MAVAVNAQDYETEVTTEVLEPTISSDIEREFFQKAYDLVLEYAASASLDNDSKRYKFQRLFENTDIKICNDLMGLDTTNDTTLSVYKYVQLLKKARRVKVTIKNLRKSEISESDTVWLMNLVFDKAIALTNNSYILYDSEDFFKEDYRLKATIAMSKESRNCYIMSLDSDGEWLEFPKEYRVLLQREKDKRDNNLYINDNKRIAFNSNGQYILRPDDKVYYNHGLIDILPADDGNPLKYQADYKDKSWRLRLNGGYSFKFYDWKSANANKEFSVGLDFGYVFKSGTRFHTGVYAGVGYSISELGISMTDVPEDKTIIQGTIEDEDGDTYDRHYKVWGNKGIKQTLKAKEFVIPLYVDLEYDIYSKISAYADLGAKFQLSSAKMNAEIDKYETWGEYKDYTNLVIRNTHEVDGVRQPNENPVSLNGFGLHNEFGAAEIDVDTEHFSEKLAIDFFMGLGLRLNFNSFAFDAGVQYVLGIPGKVNSDKAPVFSYTLGEGDKVNIFNKDIKHNALRIVASFIYKF